MHSAAWHGIPGITMAWHSMAWHAKAWLSMTQRPWEWHDVAWHCLPRCTSVWHSILRSSLLQFSIPGHG